MLSGSIKKMNSYYALMRKKINYRFPFLLLNSLFVILNF